MVDRVHDFSRLSLERRARGADPYRLENFQDKLCFQGKRKLLKNPEW